jgi:hypothetical protein
VAWIVATNAASADCKDEWICVDTIDQGGNVELRAINLREYPITYTLRVRARDWIVNGPKTVTRTLAANQSEQVMVLSNAGGRGQNGYQYSLEWTVGDKDAVHDDDHLYSLPYASGKSYRIVQGYGSRFSHTGLEEFAIDLDMPVGTPIHAARSGVVARVEESHSKGCWEDGCGKFANYVVILHSDGTTGEYYHLKKNGALIEVGDSVAQGQKSLIRAIPATQPCHTCILPYIAQRTGATLNRFRCVFRVPTVLSVDPAAAVVTRLTEHALYKQQSD